MRSRWSPSAVAPEMRRSLPRQSGARGRFRETWGDAGRCREMEGDGGRHSGDMGSYSEAWPAAAEQRARARERVDGRELRELIDPLLAHGVQRVWVLGAGLRLVQRLVRVRVRVRVS